MKTKIRFAINSSLKKACCMMLLSCILVLTLAACGKETAPIHSSSVDGIKGIELIPEVAREFYAGSDFFLEIQANPYEDWIPPSAPWTFGLSESYTGNTWRQSHVLEMQRIVEKLVQLGFATGPLKIADANGNTALQLSQFSSLADDGCDVIFVLPNSPEAMSDVFKDAHSKGILVITSSGPANSGSVINVTHNGFYKMEKTAESVIESLNGSGNILVVTGVSGTVANAAEQAAVDNVVSKYPNIKIVGSVEGKWTPSVAQTEVARFLATHPGNIDGIFEFGEMDVAVARAFRQSGREMPYISSPIGESAALALWKENPEKVRSVYLQSPEGAAFEVLDVSLRMLSGQKPSTNTLIFPVPEITSLNFNDYWKEGFSTDTVGYPKLPTGRLVTDDYWDAFFAGGIAFDTNGLLP